jgi:acetyl esterase/lipase
MQPLPTKAGGHAISCWIHKKLSKHGHRSLLASDTPPGSYNDGFLMLRASARFLSHTLAIAGGGLLAVGVPLLDIAVPRSGYSVRRDLRYGEGPRAYLDLYVPDALTAAAPVLLFFYGGSWQSGTKNIYRAFGEAFATAGVITAVADYRLYPEVKYPAFVEDGASAFQYLREKTAEYGGDPARLFLCGHSAGAYIAAMLACNPEFGVDHIRGVIGIAGPYDFLPLYDPALIDIFGGDRVMTTQPIKYARNKTPPMLLAHGTADKTVGPGNSRRMATRLSEAGNDVTLIEYQGRGHLDIVLSLAHGFRHLTTLREDMLRFIAAN